MKEALIALERPIVVGINSLKAHLSDSKCVPRMTSRYGKATYPTLSHAQYDLERPRKRVTLCLRCFPNKGG